jgi:hypothetical protein
MARRITVVKTNTLAPRASQTCGENARSKMMTRTAQGEYVEAAARLLSLQLRHPV